MQCRVEESRTSPDGEDHLQGRVELGQVQVSAHRMEQGLGPPFSAPPASFFLCRLPSNPSTPPSVKTSPLSHEGHGMRQWVLKLPATYHPRRP